MNKNWNIAAYIGVIVSLVISIVAICLAAPRTTQTAFDYQGIIVGALSMLVTALIGWQIYNIINIQSSLDKFAHKMSKIDQLEEEYRKMDIYNDAQTYESISHILYTQMRYCEALDGTLKALNRYSQVETYKDSQACINICIGNCASILQQLIIPIGETSQLAIFDKIINSLTTTPPRFYSPLTNASIQWLYVFIIDRQQNIHETLTDIQATRIKEFIANHRY